jgi:low temperature requirement protein LtrA
MAEALHHHTARMGGRDPHESHRGATTLELLFDLTFVIAFGTAANELAHFLAEDHIGAGIGGFLFATFAVSWAWINYSWFASAYDIDDWIYRLTTMVQMAGVLVLALGVQDMFASLKHGDHVDNKVMVLGYIVMRVPMLAQWARAARQDPARRRICLTYITSIVVSQIFWCVMLFVDTGIMATFLWLLIPLAIELGGPVVAERLGGTPWHAHHMAERYGLLVIIALGEGLIGTMASLSAVVGPDGPGWSAEVAVLGLAGTALTFGMWWIYFIVPCGEILHAHRERSFGWGYGHIPLFGATVAVGAGLHVAAYHVEHKTLLGTNATVLTVAVPVAAYVLGIFLLYAALTRSFDPFHLLLIAGSAAVVVASVVMARSGVSMEWCIAVLALTPWVTVLGYETVGHRHNEQVLAALQEE